MSGKKTKSPEPTTMLYGTIPSEGQFKGMSRAVAVELPLSVVKQYAVQTHADDARNISRERAAIWLGGDRS